jgi:hypothetical protein
MRFTLKKLIISHNLAKSHNLHLTASLSFERKLNQCLFDWEPAGNQARVDSLRFWFPVYENNRLISRVIRFSGRHLRFKTFPLDHQLPWRVSHLIFTGESQEPYSQ